MDGTSCGRCPAFQPFLDFDWKTYHYLKAFDAENKVMLDSSGREILRRDQNGDLIKIGVCTLRSGPPLASGEAFPRRNSIMVCHDADKYALLDRLKAERERAEAIARVNAERQQ